MKLDRAVVALLVVSGIGCSGDAPTRRWGYVDRTGHVAIAPQYAETHPFGDGVAGVAVGPYGNYWGYVDRSGAVVVQPGTFVIGWPDSDAFMFSQGLGPTSAHGPGPSGGTDRRWGYVDRFGAWVIQPEFESALPFSEGLAAVEKSTVRPPWDPRRTGPGWGYVDPSGEYVIAPQFEAAERFSEGIAAIAQHVPDPEQKFGEGDTARKWGYVDKTGTILVQPQFAHALAFHEGLAAVAVVPGKLLDTGVMWGFIDRTGTFVIPPRYPNEGPTVDPAESFSDGLAVVRRRHRSIYIDRAGAQAIPADFAAGRSFSEGLAAVATVQPDPAGGFASRWGYIDKSGRMVIEPCFTDAGDFVDGLAAVKKGHRWGYIDKTGHFAIAPRFADAHAFADGMAEIAIE